MFVGEGKLHVLLFCHLDLAPRIFSDKNDKIFKNYR